MIGVVAAGLSLRCAGPTPGPLRLGADPGGEGCRQQTEKGRERRHHHGPHSLGSAFDDGVVQYGQETCGRGGWHGRETMPQRGPLILLVSVSPCLPLYGVMGTTSFSRLVKVVRPLRRLEVMK